MSPGFSGLPEIDFYNFLNYFYDENLQFYDKKIDFRPGMEITSETTETRDPRVRRRKPGKLASRQALHVVTDFPFYGFF